MHKGHYFFNNKKVLLGEGYNGEEDQKDGLGFMMQTSWGDGRVDSYPALEQSLTLGMSTRSI